MTKKKQEEKLTFDQVLQNLNKVYGEGTLLELGSKSNGNYDTISSCSISLY